MRRGVVTVMKPPRSVVKKLLLLSCLVVAKLVGWEPYTQGSGIPQTDAEVMGRIDMPWYRVMFAKFTEGSLLTLSGLSLGREGPSIQLGGMGGKAVSRALRRGRGEERLLVTCGAAAGMSAAFHAPLTGTLFAIEEIHKEFTPSRIIFAVALIHYSILPGQCRNCNRPRSS